MGLFDPPPELTVNRLISMKGWQRTWINRHREINFSGLIQMYISEIIKEEDPEYYEKYKHIEMSISPKKERAEKIIIDLKNSKT